MILLRKSTVILLLFLLHVVHSKAQQSDKRFTFSGTVIDSETQETLPFATIYIQATGNAYNTDERGVFFIPNLKRNSDYTIIIEYLGYQQREIILKELKVFQGNIFELTPKTDQLEGITIKGIRKGEAKSLNKMKNADNIKFVLSQEQMERYPDATVGETMQRVPGIAVEYSYGLPRNIVMRGLDQSLGSITLNGTKVPSTSTNSRTVDLNGILSSSIESIEVNKTLTPDMDADGTAGSVNIITKTPSHGVEILDANLSYGYNNLINKSSYDFGLTYGNRINKWAYLLGVNYKNSRRGEDRLKHNYGKYIINDLEKTKISGIELEGTDIQRKNTALQAEISYFPTENNQFYLRGSYNKYFELQKRGSLSYSIGDYTTDNNISKVNVGTSGTPRDYNRDILMFSLGTKNDFDQWKIDADLTYSHGIYDQPTYFDGYFTIKNGKGTIDQSNNIAPQIKLSNYDINDPSNFKTNYYVNRHQFANDKDLLGNVNVSYNFDFIGEEQGLIKFGAKANHKENDHTRNYYKYNLKNGDLTLTDFLSDYSRRDFFNNNYNLSHIIPDGYLLEKYYQENQKLFIDDEDYIRQNTDPDSYSGKEFLAAAYGMTKLKFKELELTAGLRFEHSGFNYTGNTVIFDEDGKFVETNKVDVSKSFSGLFPSLNLKYSLSDNTNLRAAITKSLARPDYYDLVPWEEIEKRKKRMKIGNPNLKEATSINLDILFEHYFQSVGLLSGGVFYKKIDDYIYNGNYVKQGGPYDKWEVNQTLNGANAKVYGLEIAWQQQFTFLPGFWNGFGIYANYTYIDSQFKVPGVEKDRTVALPDMRPSVGNLALSYEKYGFSGRISLNFYNTFIKELSELSNNDILEKARKQLDISFSQRIKNNLRVFGSISNITNAQVKLNYRDGRPKDHKYYSNWMSLGLRYNF